MTNEPIRDLPWPRWSKISDEYDFDRVPFEIKQAAAGLPPDERTELLDQLGGDPSLTTVCRFHDGDTVGVVLDGDEVLAIHKGRIQGIDLDQVRNYVDRSLGQMPKTIRDDVDSRRDLLTVEAPADSDWVTVRWRSAALAEVHRSNVVPGWPPEGSEHE